MRRTLMLIAGAALMLGLAAGCSSTDTKDLEDQLAALEERFTVLQTNAQRTDMRSALDTLDSAGLHDIDEAANANGTVDAGASGPVARALLAVGTATWTEEFAEGATETAAALRELATALESADPAVVGPAAATAHEVAHEFSETARNLIVEAMNGLPVEPHEEGTAEPTAEPATAEAAP